MTESFKVKIYGAGPTGSIMALALAHIGCKVDIVDPHDSDQIISRSRAYAITHSSRRLLSTINLWPELRKYIVPFSNLILEDNVLNIRAKLGISDLRLRNSSSKAIGWIIDHKELMQLVLNCVEKNPNINSEFGRNQPFDMHDNQLIVSADGSHSEIRNLYNVGSFKFHYKQACLTSKVLLRNIEPSTAYEILRCEGPLAVLPMGNNIFQIVWSAPYDICKQRASLNSSLYLDRLASVLPRGVEPDILIDKPRVFPLQLSIAKRLYKGNTIFIGEASHNYHPVGGQGLNVSWRDVQELMNIFSKLKSSNNTVNDIPRIYARRRTNDLISIGLMTHFLVLIFSNRNPILLSFRLCLMSILGFSSFFRKITLSIMTDGVVQFHRSLPE